MIYVDYPRECRYCHESAMPDDIIKYGVRHYAHFRCWLERHDAEAWHMLHAWQRGRFPIRLLQEFEIDYKTAMTAPTREHKS